MQLRVIARRCHKESLVPFGSAAVPGVCVLPLLGFLAHGFWSPFHFILDHLRLLLLIDVVRMGIVLGVWHLHNRIVLYLVALHVTSLGSWCDLGRRRHRQVLLLLHLLGQSVLLVVLLLKLGHHLSQSVSHSITPRMKQSTLNL